MSYYNSVDLHYIDNELDFKTLEEPLKPFFDEYRIHSDVLKDVETLLVDGKAQFKLHTYLIDKIFLFISELQADVVFGVQGCGEELRDVWVREYRAGEVTFSQGPFVHE